MKFIADFHIHSHFSIATSKKLCPEYIDLWARQKGIKIVGTGDFTHPGWTKELKEKLEPAEPGLFKLKRNLKVNTAIPWADAEERESRFILTSEISSIYKKMDRVRKVHNVIFAPDFETVSKIQQKLGSIGNITSDGRPILGLDSRDLLEISLDASEENFFLPAHIWTPWFSALGAKSGFDSIQECYGDLSHHIHAIETGLSSDPAMNWLCSSLDNFTILSNSDAHSPEKLGRESNIFNTELSYSAIIQTIKTGNPNQFMGTLEFFPEEGKYHHDGHRKCGIRWHPVETMKHKEKCPVCGKKVVVGVMNRVIQLADRENGDARPRKHPYHPLIPLKEVLSEIMQTGPNSKTVVKQYNHLLEKLGPELNILLDKPLSDIHDSGNELIAEAVRRMRNREVHIKEGYDGEYGRITVFAENEIPSNRIQSTLFGDTPVKKKKDFRNNNHIQEQLLKSKIDKNNQPVQSESIRQTKWEFTIKPDDAQKKAIHHISGPALVLAGPGTGKTRVLTHRIAWLIQEKNVPPEYILAVTFTNKAAEEMRERLKSLLKNTDHTKLTIQTFHGLGYQILQKWNQMQNRVEPITIIDESDKKSILIDKLNIEKKSIGKTISSFSRYKQNGSTPDDMKDSAEKFHFHAYESFLKANGLFDLDDLIDKPLILLTEQKELRDHFQTKFQWISIDEFQDINQAQYQLIRNLMPHPNARLFAIGDSNQAIYGFRGASVRFVHQFGADYPDYQIYRLEKSYRCSNHVLQASEDVLQSDEESVKSHSLSGIQLGVKIQVLEHPTDKSEAEWIARTIEKLMGGLRFFSLDSDITQGESDIQISSLSDFAVLVRIKSQMPVIEKAFQDHSIPYQSVGDENLFNSQPAKSILDFLKNQYRVKHDQNISWMQIPKFSLNFSAGIPQMDFKKPVHINLRTLVNHTDQGEIIELEKLISFSKPFEMDYESFFKSVVLARDIDTYQLQTEKVSLLTLHAAKGLEFFCVFIPGCEDGLLPYSLYHKKPNVEEERRLFYVGMTRAKHYLFLSNAIKRTVRGQTYRLDRSPFIHAIEKNLLAFKEIVVKKKKNHDQLKLF